MLLEQESYIGQILNSESCHDNKYMVQNCKTLYCHTVLSTKNDSDAAFCFQLLSKISLCMLHLSYSVSVVHLCFNHILWIG